MSLNFKQIKDAFYIVNNNTGFHEAMLHYFKSVRYGDETRLHIGYSNCTADSSEFPAIVAFSINHDTPGIVHNERISLADAFTAMQEFIGD